MEFHRTGKGQFVFISIPKMDNAKESLKFHTTALISHASKVMLKILQARLQLYVNWELPNVHAGFRKGRGTRDHIADICWIIEKAREFQKKKSTSASLTMLNLVTVCITTNCRKFLKRWEYQTTLPVKKQQLEPQMEQWTGSTQEKEYDKAVCCHPAYFIYMQSTSCEMLGWMKHKLESRFSGEISTTSDMHMLSL